MLSRCHVRQCSNKVYEFCRETIYTLLVLIRKPCFCLSLNFFNIMLEIRLRLFKIFFLTFISLLFISIYLGLHYNKHHLTLTINIHIYTLTLVSNLTFPYFIFSMFTKGDGHSQWRQKRILNQKKTLNFTQFCNF